MVTLRHPQIAQEVESIAKGRAGEKDCVVTPIVAKLIARGIRTNETILGRVPRRKQGHSTGTWRFSASS